MILLIDNYDSFVFNVEQYLRELTSEEVRRIWPFLRDRRIDAYANLTKRFID